MPRGSPPLGHRSLAGPNAVSGYQAMSPTELTEVLDRETVVAVMIETPDAVAASDAIAAVEGVDMLIMGPHDLDRGDGYPWGFRARRLSLCGGIRRRRVWATPMPFGIASIRSAALLQRFVDLGLRFISAGTDVGMLTEAATSRVQQLRGLSTGRDDA